MLLKIAVLGICVSIVCVFLNKYYKEAVLPLEMVFMVIAAIMVTDEAKDALSELSSYLDETGEGMQILSNLVKGAMICVVTKISCDIAKDSGNTVIADIIDLAGRIVLISLCFPFVESVIKTALSFVS